MLTVILPNGLARCITFISGVIAIDVQIQYNTIV